MSKEVRKLFLLSADEYERFKENIPHWNGWWWLRSQSEYNYNAMDVDYDGLIHEYGTFITLDYGAVRPALVIEKEVYEYEIGDFYNYSIFPMVCIGHSKKYSWFISEVP